MKTHYFQPQHTLCVVIKDVKPREKDKYGNVKNGLIYDFKKLIEDGGHINRCADFLKGNRTYKMVSIVTEKGPGELYLTLKKDFGIKNGSWVGGIIGTFDATERQAKLLLEELAKKPERYFKTGDY